MFGPRMCKHPIYLRLKFHWIDVALSKSNHEDADIQIAQGGASLIQARIFRCCYATD